ARVDKAASELADARAKLARLKEQVHQAVLHDQAMQAKLEQARVRLVNAKADLAEGRQSVRDQRADLASYAVSSYQSGGAGLSNLGVVFHSESPVDMVNSLQSVDTVLDKQSGALQHLKANQVLLRLTEQRVQRTKVQVAADRRAAARSLEHKRDLKGQAHDAAQRVKQRVDDLRVQRKKISSAKKQELHRIHTMKQQRHKVEKKLHKIAERRARQRARQHHRNAAVHLSSHASNSGGYLSYPVRNTYITSPYGMRFHPILHIWELHDGTDLHAPCGRPVYAAAPGRVSSEYYSSAYGNRLFIDHGSVKGVSLQTAYNHLSGYVARAGHHVDRGQLIAYAGGTGWVTACHLHFMVFVNGSTVNPMGWL
ncbi:MAG: peptidoglycan DD-metalloendopeptidase family protein, partial [Nocardioidaceae bacterium]